MNILLTVFLIIFSVAAGLFLGAGNFKGFAGALIPGVVAGLLVGIPFLREQNWTMSAVVVVFAIVGSIAMSQIADANSLKRFFREQSSLVIRVGDYKLGHDSKK